MPATGVIALLFAVTFVLGIARFVWRSPLLGYLTAISLLLSLMATGVLIAIIASM